MDLTAFVEDLVYEPTQTEGRGLDLTVDSISRVVEPGRVDFGGGELDAAETEPIDTEKRDPEDDYGWWELAEGTYLIEYNETLSIPADVSLVVQTRDAVRARGAFHPTLHLGASETLGPVPLTVSQGGINIKENARLSTLLAD
ncbi:dCTP deaminase [Halohasta litorea]|uniref:dCTP deaminase n=1 Tax=Halohasta litorea TaxID=869891 RepID=A0ABD6D7J3_9EURY|nr:dCTP deaminase [Halohasta litorea]